MSDNHIPSPTEFFGPANTVEPLSNANSAGIEDDDDMDAMFDKYLGNVDAAQLKALMTMGDGGSGSDFTAMSKETRDALGELERGAEDYTDEEDDARAPSSTGRGKKKTATTKKVRSQSKTAISTESKVGNVKRGTAGASTAAGTAPLRKTTTVGAPSSRGVSPSAKSATGTASKTPAKGPAVGTVGGGVTVRPTLLPSKKNTKAPTAISAPGASSSSALPRLSTPPAPTVARLSTPPAVKNPTTNERGSDGDDGSSSDTEGIEGTTALVTGGKSRSEPFRYESSVASGKGTKTTTSASGVVGTTFGFQDLVNAALSVEERALHSTPEQVSEALATAKVIDLSDRNLVDCDDLMCLDNVTHLYLQHNNISTDIGGLSALMKLTVLVISHNAIESVAPLAVLDNLIFLDASFNNISELDAGSHLPSERLVELRLNGNPCAPDYDILQQHADGELVGAKAISEEELGEHYEYLEQYRAEILTFCPMLKFLDTYEVASFAPDHVQDAMEKDPQPRLLAAIVAEGRGSGGDAALEADVDPAVTLRAAEDEIDAMMREDMDGDRGEVLDAEVEMDEQEQRRMSNLAAFVTQQNVEDHQPSGLSELQAKLMEAYLGGSLRGDNGAVSSRPGTATSTSGASLRPGTAGGQQRPSSAAAAAVAALDKASRDENDSDSDDDTSGKPHGKSKDPLAGGRLGAPAGRIGSSTNFTTANAAEPSEDPRAYARASDRQKELAKELAIAQRHHDKLAELQLMELWDEASCSMRELRKRSEERRRQLLFATASGEDSTATTAPMAASGSRSTFLKGLASSAYASSSSPSAFLDNASEGGMQHSTGYLAALERLRKNSGINLDLERYRKAKA